MAIGNPPDLPAPKFAVIAASEIKSKVLLPRLLAFAYDGGLPDIPGMQLATMSEVASVTTRRILCESDARIMTSKVKTGASGYPKLRKAAGMVHVAGINARMADANRGKFTFYVSEAVC